MNEMQILGYVITALITLGSFIAIIMKFIQPVNELRIMIQKLNDAIDNFVKEGVRRDHRLDQHGRDIDELKGDVNTLKTKMDLYHHDN
jgi:hypothetical protein